MGSPAKNLNVGLDCNGRAQIGRLAPPLLLAPIMQEARPIGTAVSAENGSFAD
jgi:hypothetical protein